MAIEDIIKYEGDNTTFVWKHPREDFNSTTQLIVHETQQALFFYERANLTKSIDRCRMSKLDTFFMMRG